MEAYTTISGLPHLLAEKLKEFPDHELAKSTATPKEKALSLRGRAQKGDKLAMAIFDFQARVMGIHVANLVMALDPQFVVIGGGLMDHESTTPEPHPRDRRAVSLAAAARHVADRLRAARRDVAGHRRGAGGAVSEPRVGAKTLATRADLESIVAGAKPHP
ncbi:MAG: ROK family protein [Verrucomicrobia bacterium]|nr:ROK family protein [Verrucomicrobiota bacterium]